LRSDEFGQNLFIITEQAETLVNHDGSTHRQSVASTGFPIALDGDIFLRSNRQLIVDGVAGTKWLRWDDEQFVEVSSPWPSGQWVEIVPVVNGVVALSVEPEKREVALWRTSDGNEWVQIDFPAAISNDGPLPSFSRGVGPILTVITSRGKSHWSTIDGHTFEELVAVPGVFDRSVGTFGWVAPHPRSYPLIRVSGDGASWEEVDLRELLGVDGSYWDLTIEVTAVGSTIYVVAERQESRVLLTGEVQTPS
jgi:hypothetical protein